MVHELIGIRANIVDLTDSPTAKEGSKKLVLSSEEDHFFKENMFLRWDDVSSNLQTWWRELKSKYPDSGKRTPSSLTEMKSRLEEQPEFRRSTDNYEKHSTLLNELNRIQREGQLMDVSIAEQTLVCSNSYLNDTKVGLIYQFIYGII
jgi:hypothetical protein